MTDEQRMDRLERVVKLMIKAGLRARRQSREQDEKINILIDSQLKNEELVAALAQGQAKTGERLNALIGTVERYIAGRNGSA